jgi:hypothetical protein
MAATVMTVTAASSRKVVKSLSAVDAANGNQFANTGNCYLWVANGSGSQLTVTVLQSGQTLDGVSTAGKTLTVAAGSEAIMGPWPPGVYNDGSGYVTVNWSSGTSITAMVFST